MFKKITAVMAAALMALGPTAALESFAVAGDSFDTATFIELNTQRTDNIATRTEEDFYRFSLDTAGVVSIEFSHDYADTPDDTWLLTLYNYEQGQIISRYFKGSERNAVKICDLGLDKGDYYIRVQAIHHTFDQYTWSDVDYRVKVNFTAANDWEKEFNDDFDKATKIPVNQKINGTVRTSSEDDYYRFSLDKAGVVSIKFSHDYVDTPEDTWLLTLYNYEQGQMISRYFKGSEKNAVKICDLGLDKGDYYIRVQAIHHTFDQYTWSDVDYRVKVNFTAANDWEKEFNDDFDKATVIGLNKNYNGTVDETNDSDYYRFTLDKQQQITFGFKHGNADNPDNTWAVTVYDFNRNELGSTAYKGSSTKSDYSLKLNLPKGDYFVKVSPDRKQSELPYILRIRDPKDKEGIGGDIMTGDANGDEQINVSDIAVIASFIKGIKALDTDGQSAADVNADSKINVTDIAMIAAHIKGIKALPQ